MTGKHIMLGLCKLQSTFGCQGDCTLQQWLHTLSSRLITAKAITEQQTVYRGYHRPLGIPPSHQSLLHPGLASGSRTGCCCMSTADNTNGVSLYNNTGYSLIFRDPAWQRFLGRRQRMLLAKGAAATGAAGAILSISENVMRLWQQQDASAASFDS